MNSHETTCRQQKIEAADYEEKEKIWEVIGIRLALIATTLTVSSFLFSAVADIYDGTAFNWMLSFLLMTGAVTSAILGATLSVPVVDRIIDTEIYGRFRKEGDESSISERNVAHLLIWIVASLLFFAVTNDKSEHKYNEFLGPAAIFIALLPAPWAFKELLVFIISRDNFFRVLFYVLIISGVFSMSMKPFISSKKEDEEKNERAIYSWCLVAINYTSGADQVHKNCKTIAINQLNILTKNHITQPTNSGKD